MIPRFAITWTVATMIAATWSPALEYRAASLSPVQQAGTLSDNRNLRPPCKADEPCCAYRFTQPPCRVGCPPPVPTVVKRAEPDLSAVRRPYPCGVVILEVAIDESGTVVSSCVRRGVRSDFDRAAQFATRKWGWSVKYLEGRAVPVVMTVAVRASER